MSVSPLRSGKYHISPRTGAPAWCTARERCPFGDMEKDHFATKEEARAAYEERMQEQAIPSFDRGRINVTPLPPGVKQDGNSFVVPAGVYVVGDPVYSAGVDAKAWRDWRNVASGGMSAQDHAMGASYNGYSVLALQTPGEGVYYDSMGRAYSSSSGHIGLIPVSLAKQMGLSGAEVQDDGYLVTFNETTKIEWDKGTLYFGDRLFIKTEPDTEGGDFLSDNGEDPFTFDSGMNPDDFDFAGGGGWSEEDGNFF